MLNVGRNAEYLHHVAKCTVGVTKAGGTLLVSPAFLKPFVKGLSGTDSRFIASFFVDIKRGNRYLTKVLLPMVQDRIQNMQQLGNEYKKPVQRVFKAYLLTSG